MGNKKERLLSGLCYLAIFAFFYVWFSRIHPLIIYDADDWSYIAYVRTATPIWGDWNPAKVFPEVVMPFLCSIILHTVTPIVGDVITGYTVGHALVVSGFITVYAWCFAGLVRRTFSHCKATADLITVLFLILHLLVFRAKDWGNLYLFHCVDLNCYYNYLIPGLLNACLVMWMVNNPKFDRFLQESNYLQKGLFWLVLYLAIFSNLVVSGILAAYAGSRILLDLIRHRKTFRLKDCLNRNLVPLGILVLWFVSAVYELSGGRASSSASGGILVNAVYSLYHLKNVLIEACSSLFWLFTAITVVLCILLLIRSKGKDPEDQAFLPLFRMLLIAGAAVSVYSILLCGMVNPLTIYRSEYLFSMFFYGLAILLAALAYILKKQPRLLLLLPAVTLFLASAVNTYGNTFQESLMSDYEPAVCADISRDILNQFLEAEASGVQEAVIYVPMHVADPETGDNWPHSLVLLPRIQNALYEQGILSREFHVTYVADPSVNERFQLPIPD